MQTVTELPVATCIAAAEEIILARVGDGTIAVGPVARWSGGGEILVVGRWRSKGFFGQWCVRWISGDGKGLFGRGLAGYNGAAIPEAALAGLPVVK